MFEVETLSGLTYETVYAVQEKDGQTYFLIYDSATGWEWRNANGYKPPERHENWIWSESCGGFVPNPFDVDIVPLVSETDGSLITDTREDLADKIYDPTHIVGWTIGGDDMPHE